MISVVKQGATKTGCRILVLRTLHRRNLVSSDECGMRNESAANDCASSSREPRTLMKEVGQPRVLEWHQHFRSLLSCWTAEDFTTEGGYVQGVIGSGSTA